MGGLTLSKDPTSDVDAQQFLILNYILNPELQSHRVFFILTQRYKDTRVFVSGRYKEHLKLLYKVHKDFHPQRIDSRK